MADLPQIPYEIRYAAENGKLVIFTGAGISMAPPSALPSFTALVCELAKGGVQQCENISKDKFPGKNGCETPWKQRLCKQTPDKFLGIKKDDALAVHERCRRYFRDRKCGVEYEASEGKKCTYSHSLMHVEILRIFRKAKNIKLVTTNFDDRFDSALHFLRESDANYFGSELLPQYFAPALPRGGDDFQGIVYIHGKEKAAYSSLILTDEDFAKAYITDRWATDFLLELFRHYTVLFLGYSHDDPLMQYFSRGLSQHNGSSRYILLSEPGPMESKDDIEFKRVSLSSQRLTVMQYANQDGYHSNCLGTIQHLNAVLRHERSLIEDAAKQCPSPLDPESERFIIDHVINHPESVQIFFESTNHLHAKEWFYFVTENPRFTEILLKNSEFQFEFMRWVALGIAKTHSNEVIVHLKKVRDLNYRTIFVGNVISLLAGDPTVPSDIMAEWISFALPNMAPYKDYVERLLHILLRDEISLPTQVIFQVTQWFINLQHDSSTRSFVFNEKEMHSIDLSFPSSTMWIYYLELFEGRYLNPAIERDPSLYWKFFVIEIRKFSLDSATKGGEASESINRSIVFRWDNIHNTGADPYHDTLKLFCRCFYHCLKNMVPFSSEEVLADARRFISSATLFEKKIGLSILSILDTKYANEAISSLQNHHLIDEFYLRPECVAIAKRQIGSASKAAQAFFLAFFESHFESTAMENTSQSSFTVLSEICKIDDVLCGYSALKSRLEDANPEIHPSAHPATLSVPPEMSGGPIPSSILSLAFAQMSSEEIITEFSKEKYAGNGLYFWGETDELRNAIRSNRNLCNSLFEIFCREKTRFESLIIVVVPELLSTLESTEQLVSVIAAIPHLIRGVTSANCLVGSVLEVLKKHTQEEISQLDWFELVRISSSTWDRCAEIARLDEIAGSTVDPEDTYSRSINLWPGTLTEAFIFSLRNRYISDETRCLTEDERLFLYRILSGDDLHNLLALSILASRMQFFYWFDPDFVKVELISRLAYAKGELIARAAWEGFSYGGFWNDDLKNGQMEALGEALKDDVVVSSKVDFLGEFLADIIVVTGGLDFHESPQQEWFRILHQTSGHSVRMHWLRGLAARLQKLDNDYLLNHQQKWIQNYIQYLLDGIYGALSEDEIGELWRWLVEDWRLHDWLYPILSEKPFPGTQRSLMLHILVDKEKQKQQKTLYLAAIIADCININDFNYHVFGYMTDDVCSFLRTLKSQILSQEKRESLKRWLNSIQGANAEEILEAITR